MNLDKPSLSIHKKVLVFSFISVIQSELNEFRQIWNCRNIRKSAEASGGGPEMLLNIPALVGFLKRY